MTPDAVAAMLSEDREAWGALCALLDAHPDGPLHDPESPAWTARDVYAHLARWITHSTDDLETVLAGGAPAVIEGTDDEINARWQAEGAGLSLTEARRRAPTRPSSVASTRSRPSLPIAGALRSRRSPAPTAPITTAATGATSVPNAAGRGYTTVSEGEHPVLHHFSVE